MIIPFDPISQTVNIILILIMIPFIHAKPIVNTSQRNITLTRIPTQCSRIAPWVPTIKTTHKLLFFFR